MNRGAATMMRMSVTASPAARNRPMEEPAIGLVETACAVGLGEIGVEAEEDAGDTKGDGAVEDLAESAGGDGERGVGHVSDHDGVDDAHRHPAEFGEDERDCKREHGTDLSADRHGFGAF